MRFRTTALGTLVLAAGLTTVAAQPTLAQATVVKPVSGQHLSAGDPTVQSSAFHRFKKTKNWKCGKASHAWSSPAPR